MAAQRVLLVEDEEAVLFAMRHYFSGSGYEVEAASTLAEALDHLDRGGHDLVITDLALSGHRGAEGLAVVRRALQNQPRPVVVVITAYGSPEVEQEALQLGAARLLHKPLPLFALAQVVRELVQRNQPPG